ncbi:MAG: hypothetical protein GXP56_19220 [Deltaproteobacteria bacterium]|nr:hypothetical protein [Deltaproteobacteria bacterium]
MSDEFCMDCGSLLAPYTRICPVCGFDNAFDQQQEIPIDETFLNDLPDDFIPENYPGY